jgi:DNA-binding NarL/FixJ family response regulator
MDLTTRIPLLLERRKVMQRAIISRGLDLSVAIAFEREELLLPIAFTFENPTSVIQYLGTDTKTCLDAFNKKVPGFFICGESLNGGDGFKLTKTIRSNYPKTKILLVCTGAKADSRVRDANWIDGIFYLQEALEGKGVIQEAVLAATGGHRYRSERIRSLSEFQSDLQLKERDYQILHCLADGMNNREISARLQISE